MIPSPLITAVVKVLTGSNKAFKLIPYLGWEFSIFSSRLLLEFSLPKYLLFYKNPYKHLACWKHVTLSLFIQTHLQMPAFLLLTIFKSLFLLIFLFRYFLQTQNICTNIISESLHVHGDSLSPSEQNDILEFLHSIPLLSMLFYHLLSFRHSKGMSNAGLYFPWGLSLLNKSFIFTLEARDLSRTLGIRQCPLEK